MAQGQSGNRSDRIVRLTSEAEDDRLLAYLDTQQVWGTQQANNYDDFLLGIMQQLADMPGSGSLIENVPGVRRYFARWKNARNGHYLFYGKNRRWYFSASYSP
jgi:plasmid stabilization system protein ParE